MVSSELSDHKPGVLTAFRVLFAFASAAVIVVVVLYATRGSTTYDEARSTKRYETLKKLNDENAKKIGEYAVVDKAKGIYQLPLKNAITLTARDLAKIQPHSAYPVVTAPVIPAAATAPAASPATMPAPNPPAVAPQTAAAAQSPAATPAEPVAMPAATPAAQP